MFDIFLIILLLAMLYSLIKIISLKWKIKTVATIVDFGFERHINRDNDTMNTILRYNVNGNEIISKIAYYHIFMKRGKKIKVFYDPNNYTKVECLGEYLFGLIISSLLLVIMLFFI